MKRRVGIPYKVRGNDTDFFSFTQDCEFNKKPISWRSQNKVFEKYLHNPLQEEFYTFLISCDYNNVIPQLAATAIVNKTRELCRVPFWYNVSKNHKQEDERLMEFYQENNGIDLLIIDGVYTKTNINNIDKVRELLALFDNIPVYIIISGGFGPEFFENQVFCSFNLFIHFGASPRKKVYAI